MYSPSFNYLPFKQISDALKGNIKGLCGKYNGDPSDDFETQNGQIAASAADFAESWKKTGLNGNLMN